MSETERDVYLTVPMIHDMELAVSKTAEVLAGLMNFNKDKTDEVKQALIEACINSIEHSNSNDRHIYIHFRMLPDALKIKVTDKGKGFDASAIKSPNISQKLFMNARKRGWGLMLIRHYMDALDIESGSEGTTLSMCKYLK
jgi:anti-sigma regulatory factor (Ser/Thr protein kinase)